MEVRHKIIRSKLGEPDKELWITAEIIKKIENKEGGDQQILGPGLPGWIMVKVKELLKNET